MEFLLEEILPVCLVLAWWRDLPVGSSPEGGCDVGWGVSPNALVLAWGIVGG
jgi:hypothetical protein